jgi:hypothetical protein
LQTDEFVALWNDTNRGLPTTVEDIEHGRLVREGNGANSVKNYKNQDQAQYGRLFFRATAKIAKITELKESEVFVDIGSGIGNAVMQMACTVGCEARGVELLEGRHVVGKDHIWPALERTISERSVTPPQIGNVDLLNSDLTSPDNAEFLSSSGDGRTVVALVNNFGGIFSCRSNKLGQLALDDHVARLFAQMRPGSRMVTMEPLHALGMDLKKANQIREQRKLKASNDASFFEGPVEHVLKPFGAGSDKEDVASWTGGEIKCYLYTRTRQSIMDACFLCSKQGCPGASEPTQIVRDLALVEECIYCDEPRLMNTRTRSSTTTATDSKS